MEGPVNIISLLLTLEADMDLPLLILKLFVVGHEEAARGEREAIDGRMEASTVQFPILFYFLDLIHSKTLNLLVALKYIVVEPYQFE